MKIITPFLFGCAGFFVAGAATVQKTTSTVTNIAYYTENSGDEYKDSQCRLDLRIPEGKTGFPTVIWLHGGGLTGGKRGFVGLGDEIGVVAVGYRLSPKAEHPAYLEDAAAATAWVLGNIAAYGGDTNKVFLAGHSAGGYLAAMAGMDPRWLGAHGITNNLLAGIIPVSGQVTTHFHVKKLLGDTGPASRPLVDNLAPFYYCSKDLPPICLILGDRRIEYPCRVEENEFFAATLRAAGHGGVEFYEMGGLDHVTVVQGGAVVMRRFVQRICKDGK